MCHSSLPSRSCLALPPCSVVPPALRGRFIWLRAHPPHRHALPRFFVCYKPRPPVLPPACRKRQPSQTPLRSCLPSTVATWWSCQPPRPDFFSIHCQPRLILASPCLARAAGSPLLSPCPPCTASLVSTACFELNTCHRGWWVRPGPGVPDSEDLLRDGGQALYRSSDMGNMHTMGHRTASSVADIQEINLSACNSAFVP